MATPTAEQVRKSRAKRREVRIPECENKKRRESCRRDLRKFLLTYRPESFPLAFSTDHLEVIAKLQHAVLTGGYFVLACWRSFGKTTISEGCAEWAALYGHKRYILLIGATQEAAAEMVDSITTDLEENEMLYADFPEVCACVRDLEGRPQKAASQTHGGERTHIAVRKSHIAFPVIPSGKKTTAARGQIIKALGLTGRLRGLKHKLPSGEVVRPDFTIPDDPQTDESAKSPEQCSRREKLIRSAVLGSSGPGSKMSCVMPCTVIERNDLSDRFLDGSLHPEFQRVRCRLVRKWPDAQATMWAEYAQIRLRGVEEGDAGASATEYYRANRAAMDVGADMAWPEWHDDDEISGLQHAENLLIKLGEHSFAAEYQGEPLKQDRSEYELTAKLICSRTVDRAICEVPDGTQAIVAATDLNPSYALKSGVAGYSAGQTAAVLWYDAYKGPGGHGIASNQDTSRERAQAVFEALVVVGKRLAGLPCKPELWVIDASGTDFDTVLAFCAQSVRLCGLVAVGVTGRASKKYRPYGKAVIGQPREQCHMTSDARTNPPRKWIVFNSDYWGEGSQRAWLGSPGAPGCVTLFEGRHNEFAEEIVREQLHGKGMIGGEMIWNWHTQPGPHDYGDVMKMLYVAAAWQGIGTQGQTPQRKKVPAAVFIGRPSQRR